MCFHKWKEYKDIANSDTYRICAKCGIARKKVYSGYGDWFWEKRPYLCRTNSWKLKEIYILKEGH